MLAPTAEPKRRFQLVLIKPSHYDDDGYVIQWLRSSVPSNSLAAIYALVGDAAERKILGPDVEIDTTVMDETNTRVRPERIIAQLARHGGFGMVGLVGVQSNQFPRALDLARPLRTAGIPVIIGGFHVSGCLSMLTEMQADLRTALDLGISLFAGEAEEGRIDEVLRHAAAGRLEPIYDYMADLPGIEAVPPPFLPPAHVERTTGKYASFDAGRGCPYQCSFCTIINVQGRKSRRRSPDDIEAIIRQNWAKGISRFFITDDNFARNKDWEAIFDRIIKLRGEGINLGLIIQVDTLCHKIPNFIEKAKRAGVRRAFIGLENINPDNLLAAKKRQNKITEYRKMLLAWKQAGVITYAGYILGFPNDTPESIRRDIEIIKRELPLDILEFFCLTPLPGSEDHKVLWQKGVWMDPDMNKYDVEHVVTGHARMSKEDWEGIYREAWDTYYTPEHMATVMRRAAATGTRLSRLLSMLVWFSMSVRVEKVHPLQSGIFRLKYRRDRRPGLPLEPAWAFYPKYSYEILSKHAALARQWWRLARVRRRIKADPNARAYTDQALRPSDDDEIESLEMFTQSDAARAAVKRAQDQAKLTALART